MRQELGRLLEEADGLRQQIDLLAEGRFRMQDAISGLPDSAVALQPSW